MQKADIHPGHEYALREPVVSGSEFQRVKVLEHVRRAHWRVEWIEPNPGLVDYVKSANLIVPWGERRAFLRDERNAAALAQANEAFPGDRHPVAEATEEILDHTGEVGVVLRKGILEYQADALERLALRARIETPSHPAGYRDRNGTSYLPFSCALELAQAFARSEPQTVLDAIDTEERQWAQRLREPGNAHLNPLLTDWRARWALIRQWAGHDAAVATREARISDLERLLGQVMWDLRRPEADCQVIASRIERVLRP